MYSSSEEKIWDSRAQVWNVSPVGSNSSPGRPSGLLPMRYEADNGVRETRFEITDEPMPTLTIVNEGKEAAGAAGCGCAGSRQKLVAIATAGFFIAVILGIAYGVSKLIPS